MVDSIPAALKKESKHEFRPRQQVPEGRRLGDNSYLFPWLHHCWAMGRYNSLLLMKMALEVVFCFYPNCQSAEVFASVDAGHYANLRTLYLLRFACRNF